MDTIEGKRAPSRFAPRMRGLWAGVFAIALAPQVGASITYSVNYDGATVDLSGFVTVDAPGTYTAVEFDAHALAYSITASNNGADAHTFTAANSTWGSSGFLSLVSIVVSAGGIDWVAPTGSVSSATNTVLIADTATNGARENLALAQDQLRYRTPSPPDLSLFETVRETFRFAVPRSVPEPGTLLLLGLGAVGLVARRRAPQS